MESVIGIITSVLSAIIVFLIKENITLKHNVEKEKEKRKNSSNDLLLGVARVMLIDKIHVSLDQGYTTQNDYEVVEELYKAYSNSGGNGVIKHLFKDRYNSLKVK